MRFFQVHPKEGRRRQNLRAKVAPVPSRRFLGLEPRSLFQVRDSIEEPTSGNYLMLAPSAWCCALQSNGRSIRRVSASKVRSTGWRPSAIASTIRGERNPSGIRRRAERPSIPSRLAKSLTERTLPDTSSLAQRLARATAFSKGRSTGTGLDSPSSTIRISTPRRFICIGTSRESIKLTGPVTPDGSAGASGSFSDRWRLSRLSWTRSMSLTQRRRGVAP